MAFQKKGVTPLEAELQRIAASYGFAPHVHSYKDGTLVMDHIDGSCLADLYSDDSSKIPARIWDEIRRILEVLYEREGIEYIDITSYNFVEDVNGKLWIIDFGDAKYTEGKVNWFLREFLDGENGWNPDFA
jgi:RIO-like serine/threonine protein kinase